MALRSWAMKAERYFVCRDKKEAAGGQLAECRFPSRTLLKRTFLLVAAASSSAHARNRLEH
jgi:hypothetical protein